MVEEPVKEDIVFLVQLNSKNRKRVVSSSVEDENLRFETVEHAEDIYDRESEQNIIAFIIGSEVQDPVQTAQRLHVINKNASIVIFSSSENIESLKKAIKFSPFIGMDVFCLNESKEAELEVKLDEILENSRQAAKYRDILAETDPGISFQSSLKKSAVNESFINKLMDIAPIGIAIVDQDGKILGWNKEAALIFKKNEARVLGTTLHDLFPDREKSNLRSYLEESFVKNRSDTVDSLTVERELKETSKQVLNITAAPFARSGESEKVLILTIKDITEQRRAQEDLQAMNETLEERVEERTQSLLSYQKQLRSLASQLSLSEENQRQQLASELHDNLAQLLAVGKMKVELLKKEQFSDQAATDIDELKDLMDDAITYTRGLMSDLKPPPSIGEDLKASMLWVTDKVEKHGLKVNVEDDELPKPLDEKVRTIIIQSVRELLFNVIRHTTENEALVKLRRYNNSLEITVKDEGEGFDVEKVDSASHNGGRFGLFNIQERIDLLGGRVDINSEVGGGTKVILTLPLKGEAETTANSDMLKVADQDKTKQKEYKFEGKVKILLVDDQQMVREGFRKIIDEQDDIVVIGEAADGEEAVKLARKLSPDIILMDVSMPVMDGIEATRKITSEMPNIQVIGLSLHEEKEVAEEMRKAGASAYLTKTEAFESLVHTIRAEASVR